MNKDRVVRIIYWLLFGAAIGCLYISLRTKDSQLEYSILAFGFWGGAFFLNRYFKPK